MTARAFDDHACFLGEGPLWHPRRGELFWFDIINATLFAKRPGGERRRWDFAEMVSAAGWIDADTLLLAGASGLFRFGIEGGDIDMVAPFPQGPVSTRSNDGRADRQGGFWIGTMGLNAEPGAGAIFRYHRGELRLLFPDVTIPNAICFAADGGTAFWADTRKRVVWRQRLDVASGWPVGAPETFLAYGDGPGGPDGAVIDAAGDFWIAEWGASRVACFGVDGRLKRSVAVPAPHASCPAFGGPDLATLFVTTAREGMDEAALAAAPLSGRVFALDLGVRGLAESQVVL